MQNRFFGCLTALSLLESICSVNNYFCPAEWLLRKEEAKEWNRKKKRRQNLQRFPLYLA